MPMISNNRRTIPMNLHLDLQLASAATDVPAVADFERWCKTALAGARDAAELCIRIVDEEEGRELNRDWRGKDYATNVLSFVADIPPGILDIPLLGDLVICAPVVTREAREQHKSVHDHYAHLTVHGVLHLLGYDHVVDRDALRMESLEVRILDTLGIANPYR